MNAGDSFTGRTRRRTTRRTVILADRLARGMITIGGVATIVQVSVVCLFLLWVALPLFRAAAVGQPRELAGGGAPTRPLHVATDEQQLLGWALRPDGVLDVFCLADGLLLESRPLFADRVLTAASFPVQEGEAAFGFADGSVQLGEIAVRARFLDVDEEPAAAAALHAGAAVPWRAGMLQRTPEGQLRWETVTVQLRPVLTPDTTAAAVRLIAHTRTAAGPIFCLLDDAGALRMEAVRERRNLITGQTTYQVSEGRLPYTRPAQGDPRWLLLGGQGDVVLLAWPDGTLVRYDTRDLARPQIAETIDVAPDPGTRLTALGFMNGGVTLIAGDSGGRLRAWFRIKPLDAFTSDGAVLTAARAIEGTPAAVTALGFSSRGRLAAAGFADGTVEVYHVTSGRRLARARAAEGATVDRVSLAPKDDGFLALAGRRAAVWRLDARHPEASLAALFTPIWYEGYLKPAHVWQSSSATDESELKFGLMPLVFGTLKATFYSLLFGVPLALLAAVYTSEFLKPRVKAQIKPTIELMASLPSVVLGFVAALVIAPFAERAVPAILTGFVAVPLAFLAGAVVWQLLPQGLALRLGAWRPLAMAAVLPAGVLAAAALGPAVERLLFAGDLRLWLDGQAGGPLGGWLILTLPVAALTVVLLSGRLLRSWQRGYYAAHGRAAAAAADALLTLGGAAAALALALLASIVLTAVGLDPRGGVFGTYVQRNSLVVGFVMGFAIIPIIYTIAEDALSSVPEHLRAASLGAGATPWQTAVRIVIPTAMSGLFSAVMIGLGRAVGETMIVLMAAGNTPIMEWNVFNGFRTLSANIAVEMPEAVRDSTHYRILFLAALTLFAMTFVLNTVAEVVRQRFRKRAFEL